MKKTSIFLGILLTLFIVLPLNTTAATATYQKQLQQVLQTSVQYELPYPGILPDNALYPLKAVRDRLVYFFISDPLKRAQFDLLQADKRLAASQTMQTKGGEDQLVSDTTSKAENYFSEAVGNVAQAKKEGRLVNDFLDRLTIAGVKHQQVLYKMMQQSHGQLRADLQQDIQRVQEYESQVNTIKAQK